MKKRAIELAKSVGILIGIGIAYYIFHSITDIGIKCPFYLITGYLCPGCGISRMLLALFALDIPAAIYYHAVAFFLLPFWGAVFISYYYEYIRYDRTILKTWHKAILVVSVILFIVYGIARNVTELGLYRDNNIDYKDLVLNNLRRYL